MQKNVHKKINQKLIKEIFMGTCGFIDELSKLRKSSKDSVDNTETFSEFKKYMHVTREIENDLKEILRYINQNGNKSLVLLCGSAGDGKSHLLSYLKNNDDEKLLSGYTIYNDGTESISPTKTAIDTLNELLIDYSDENLLRNSSQRKNTILAINLGVLNNFIESEYGINYNALKNYILDRGILTSRTINEVISPNAYFQSINFSDYHMFNLSENGIDAVFVEKLLDKVFNEEKSNPFFKKYKDVCISCTYSHYCPVKHNYEFMIKKECQKYVANLLTECMIKDKMILTARELQNFMYDIVVPLNFNPIITMDATNVSKRISTYLSSITPSLLFDQKDTSHLANVVEKYDPVKIRTEKMDEAAIEFYVANDIEKELINEFFNLPYLYFIKDDQIIKRIAKDKIYRTKLFSIIKRCDFDCNNYDNDVYKNFLLDLYRYNSNNVVKLNNLYDAIEHAVKQWCGTDEDDNLCIETNKSGYELFEEVDFEVCDIECSGNPVDEDLNKFANDIEIKYKDSKNEAITLVIDYDLYKLIMKLNKGYVHTSEDRNSHADFLTFIKKIKNSGNADKKIIVTAPDGTKVTFKKTNYGYSYKNK